MGILQSKKAKQKEKHPLNKNIKNVNTKEAAPDLKHDEAKALNGNLNNTANTSQGLDPTQLVGHQMEPSSGNEAMLTRMHQVPPVDAPQNREQNIHKAVSISQNADPVKYILYLASARPTAEQSHGVKIAAGEFDVLKSDVLPQLQDVPEKLRQQQSRPSAPVQQQTKPVQHQKKTTAPVQQQANRQAMYGHTQHEESRNFSPSQQRPAAKETTEVPLPTVRPVAPCDMGMRATADSVHVAALVLCKDTSRQVECSFGSKEQQEMSPQLPASKMQAAVRRTHRGVVRGATSKNRHSKEVKTKAKINKLTSQKYNCVLSNVNDVSTDVTCHATFKAHTIAELRATTKPGTDEVPAAKPTEPANQQIAEETVTTVQESSQQKGRTAMEENPVKKHSKPHQIPTPNKADSDNNGNTSSCVQRISIKARAPQVLVAEEMPTAAPNNAATHNPKTAAADTSVKLKLKHELSLPKETTVKPKTKCTLKALNQDQAKKKTKHVTMKEETDGKNGQVEKEKQEPGNTPAVVPEHKARAEGRWHPFTVYQSCPYKVCCQHNPGTGSPPNVENRPDECPNNTCEPLWVTTVRFAACLALRETQEEEGASHQ